MTQIIKSINFSELKDGMIVAKDVEQSGRVVLKKGLKKNLKIFFTYFLKIIILKFNLGFLSCVLLFY